MSMYKQKVALDLDGVIWDLVVPWINQYNILFNDDKQLEDITEYKLSNTLVKATSQELDEILLNNDFWKNVLPFKYAVEYLEKLNNEFDLYIVTKTDYRLFEIKVNRILHLFPFIQPYQIVCLYNKQLFNADWFVDDCIDNLVGGNFNKIILDAPYNRDTEYNWYRAYNLKDVYNIIKYGDNN